MESKDLATGLLTTVDRTVGFSSIDSSGSKSAVLKTLLTN